MISSPSMSAHYSRLPSRRTRHSAREVYRHVFVEMLGNCGELNITVMLRLIGRSLGHGISIGWVDMVYGGFKEKPFFLANCRSPLPLRKAH